MTAAAYAWGQGGNLLRRLWISSKAALLGSLDVVAVSATFLGVPLAYGILISPAKTVVWLAWTALGLGVSGLALLAVRWALLRSFLRELREGLAAGADLMRRLAWMHLCHLILWRAAILALAAGTLSLTLLLLGHHWVSSVLCIVLAGFAMAAMTPATPVGVHGLALGAMVDLRLRSLSQACSLTFFLPRRLVRVTLEDAVRSKREQRSPFLAAIHANLRLYRESGRSSLPLPAINFQPDDRGEARAIGLAMLCYLRLALVLSLLLVMFGFPFLDWADGSEPHAQAMIDATARGGAPAEDEGDQLRTPEQ